MDGVIPSIEITIKDRQRTDVITLAEYHVIRRLRQLHNQGADIAIVHLSDGPRVRTVGKIEGSKTSPQHLKAGDVLRG